MILPFQGCATNWGTRPGAGSAHGKPRSFREGKIVRGGSVGSEKPDGENISERGCGLKIHVRWCFSHCKQQANSSRSKGEANDATPYNRQRRLSRLQVGTKQHPHSPVELNLTQHVVIVNKVWLNLYLHLCNFKDLFGFLCSDLKTWKYLPE